MITNFSPSAAAAHFPFFKKFQKLGQFLLLLMLTFLVQQKTQAQYLETFSTPNKGYLTGNTDDFSGVNWTLSTWSGANRDSDDFFQTNANGQLVATDLDQQVCWESPLLDIAGTGANSISVFLGWSGFDSDVSGDPCDVNVLDHIAVFRSIDGGSYVQIDNVVGSAVCSTVGFSFSSTPFTGAGSLLGSFVAGNSTLKIKICANVNENAETVTVDNVSVPAAGVTICNNLQTWYADADGDGFGNPNVSQTVCTQPSGYVSNDDDCDDNDDDRFPNNPEICDGKDNNCNSVVDDVVVTCTAGTRTWTGAISTDWHTACNWSPACVPTAADDVSIPNVANDPTISAAAVAKSVTVQSGAVLTVAAAASLALDGATSTPSLLNQGTVDNSGTLNIGASTSGGNFGIRNESQFNNHAGGQINIDRITGSGVLTFGGTFTNEGTMTLGGISGTSVGNYGLNNQGIFNNNSGGQIHIDRANVYGIYTPSGTFNNWANITIGANASVGNSGIFNGTTFNNSGLIDINRAGSACLFNIFSSANFQNSGQIQLGLVLNNGTDGLTNANGAVFSNLACGEISLNYKFGNNNGSTFSNAGFFKINSAAAHFNNSTFTNNGILEYPQGNPIPSVTNNEIIAAPISGTCTISPALSLGAMVDFDIATDWFLDENLTMPAGVFDEMSNTFLATNLPDGVQTTVYFSVTDNANSCSKTVSIKITSTYSFQYFEDADGDGWGNPAVMVLSCTSTPPNGYINNADDCDDTDDDRYPGNPEICDGKDNDCNLVVDDVVANCAAGYRAWTGAVSTDWHTACNWSPACVPTADDDVIVQNVATDPEITAAAVAKSVTVESGAMLTIAAAGSLTINGSSGNSLTNYGTVQNSGEITIGNTASGGLLGLDNYGTFNHNSGTINIDNSSFAALRQNPAGSFTNFADIVIGANTSVNDYGLIAYGLFSNQGNIQIDRFSFAGLLPNQSTSDFQNFGLVTIGENASPGQYSIFNSNNGSVVNQQCGEFRLFAPYLQQSTSDFTNYGLMRVNATGAHSNDNLLTNHGIIEYPQGNPIPGVLNNEIIAAPISGGCTISPALSLGTTVDFDIATEWFLDENLTMPAGTFNEATNTFSNSNLPSGVPTTVYFEIEDAAGGCTRVVSIEITSTCTPTCSGVTAEITGEEDFCASPGNFVTLTASISTTADTYLWDDNSTDATRDVNQLGAVTYSVTITDTDGCTASESFTVTGLVPPTPAITGINSICSGQSTTLNANGGSDYEWSTGDMDNQIETPDLTASTTYFVTATAANGCTASVAKTVFVKNLPVVNITGNTTLCEGQNTKLTATLFNSTYLWDPTGATTSSITVAPLTTTTYSLTLTSNSTGCSNTGSVTVNLTGPCTCESNNLFTNPGFESGKTGWTTNGSVLVTSVAAEVHGGTKALKMCGGAAAGNQRKAALPQQSFTFSGWAKGSGTNNKFVGVQFLGANLTVLSETNQTINSPSYQQFSFVATAPEGTKWVKANFSNGAGSGCLFVDDFCLVQTVLSIPKNGGQPTTTQFSEFDFSKNENLEQPAEAPQLLVFPNPTADFLNLNFSDQEDAVAGQVEVFNSVGQRVLIQNLKIEVGEESVLSVGHLPEGAYFLIFRNEKSESSRHSFFKI